MVSIVGKEINNYAWTSLDQLVMFICQVRHIRNQMFQHISKVIH